MKSVIRSRNLKIGKKALNKIMLQKEICAELTNTIAQSNLEHVKILVTLNSSSIATLSLSLNPV